MCEMRCRSHHQLSYSCQCGDPSIGPGGRRTMHRDHAFWLQGRWHSGEIHVVSNRKQAAYSAFTRERVGLKRSSNVGTSCVPLARTVARGRASAGARTDKTLSYAACLQSKPPQGNNTNYIPSQILSAKPTRHGTAQAQSVTAGWPPVTRPGNVTWTSCDRGREVDGGRIGRAKQLLA